MRLPFRQTGRPGGLHTVQLSSVKQNTMNLAVNAWLLVCLGAVMMVMPISADADLIGWISSNGGFVDFNIHKPCETCVRGAFATRAYKAKEVIAKVPLNISLDLGPHGFEAYRRLAELVYIDTVHNVSHEHFWNTQPGPDGVLTVDNLSPHLVDMLQSTRLQHVVSAHQQTLATVHEELIGKLKEHGLEDSELPSLEFFKYLAALSTSRSFAFTDPVSGSDHTYLIPAVDMINHELPANVDRQQHGSDILVVATKDIQANEELTYAYDAQIIHRDDLSLLIYGFVVPKEDPLLSASDLAQFSESNPWVRTSAHDSGVEGAVDKARIHGEITRLQNLLAESGSTLEDDEALLSDFQTGKGLPKEEAWGWKEGMIMQWRVLRKKAITKRITTLMENAAEL